jgi:hypothetical protein
MGNEKTDHTLGTGWGGKCTTELERLSNDPALTKHPDPNFHSKFHDPDELCEEEPINTGVVSTVPRTQPHRTGGELRRSPKE